MHPEFIKLTIQIGELEQKEWRRRGIQKYIHTYVLKLACECKGDEEYNSLFIIQ